MRRILSLCLMAALMAAYFAPGSASAQSTFAYQADYSAVLANPERGFHNRYEIIDDVSVNDYASSATSIAGFNPDMLDRTFARAKQSGNTLIHSYIHLDKFKDVDQLPQALLDNLASGLAAIREAGLKIVLRPAYEWSGTPNVPESRILSHIAELNAVISVNADVVNHLEAGYLGPWGEWHSCSFCDPFNRQQADTRFRVVKQILATTPVTIPVVIRYPIFIKELMELPTPSGTTALTQEEKDRIGFHNDCFLSDSADMGTYDNNSWMGWYYVEEKKQWMYDLATSTGANKMVGGETCNSSGSNDSAGSNVQTEMSLLHWTEINEDYAEVNLDIWKNANLAASGHDPAETAFTRLKRKMGYRLTLDSASFDTSGSPGGTIAFSAELDNDGYAGPIKPRPLFLVFENDNARYEVELSGIDIRLWKSGPVSIPVRNVQLPSAMLPGVYKLALWLPDYYESLRGNPAYSIRLANAGLWDADRGYNVLHEAVVISGEPSAPAAPANLSAAAGDGAVQLSWTPSAGAEDYTVLRSEVSGTGYQLVADAIAGTGYQDSGLTNGVAYYYVVKANNNIGSSGNSNEASAVPLAASAPAAPGGLTAVPGNNQVALSWNAVAGAAGYSVYRSDISGTGYVLIANQASGTAVVDYGVSNGQTYYYVVQAYNAGGSSGNSGEAQAVPQLVELQIDTFGDPSAFSGKTNDLNESIDWTMDNAYYGSDAAGNIILNSGSAGQYFRENINGSLAGSTNLVLRLRDWWDSDSEQHWDIVLNDGSDHTAGPLSQYGNVSTAYADIVIPLADFQANLSNVSSIKLVHNSSTYAVLLVDSITAN
ncbi:DUF4832 domain-containing protein [Paenibacillus sp. HB172176]|uniref:DUF4832 domain-containing protein n=1 Tax=Paenibacillus sp. HB172176 TaxID=2493690 RepID=UPI00143B6BE0|nr:DUF4832 domain-containing protein [Paenibacillus sp. HB172176]